MLFQISLTSFLYFIWTANLSSSSSLLCSPPSHYTYLYFFKLSYSYHTPASLSFCSSDFWQFLKLHRVPERHALCLPGISSSRHGLHGVNGQSKVHPGVNTLPASQRWLSNRNTRECRKAFRQKKRHICMQINYSRVFQEEFEKRKVDRNAWNGGQTGYFSKYIVKL